MADFVKAVAAISPAPYDVIAVNDIGAEFDQNTTAWCSLHGEKFVTQWFKQREKNGLAPVARTFTGLSAADDANVKAKVTDCVQAMFPDQTVGGSSGLFAAKVALLDLGYDRAVLCGIPMEAGGAHFFDSRDDAVIEGHRQWSAAESHRAGWRQALPHLDGKVFSMSGWTRQLLGSI